MRKILCAAALLLFASVAVAGHKFVMEPAPKPVQFRFWAGVVVNPEGVGPKADLEVRWAKRYGVKMGLGFPRVKDVGCGGGALFCPALHGTPVVKHHGHHWHKPQPAPTVTFHTEQDWSVDIMFSWTKRQRQ